jgi:hypothetical protein
VLSCAMLRALLWLLVAGLPVSCATAPSRDTALPARRSVALTAIVFSGHRYIVPVNVDRAAGVPLMVHGNSTMYLSITHRVGEKLNGGPVAKVEDYGYSSRGKGVLGVRRLRIGGEDYPGAPDVPVFDFAEEGETPVQGMLGVPFLLASQAAVDFSKDRLLLGVTRNSKPDPALLASGYRCVPILIGPGGRATVEVHFPAIDRALPVTPSTVSTALTLHPPPFVGKVPMVRAESQDRSPRGTTPDEFHSDRVDFEIAGVRMRSPASFEDLAQYGKVSERDLETFGMLGFDWMKEHRAVLDYANRRLYFKP